MAKNHPLFHKLKSIVGYSIAIVVIVIALGVSGLRFLLTTANLYQNEVEELASSLLEQPVKIGSMDAKLTGLVPTLIFRNVQLISEQSKRSLFTLSRIDVGLSFKSLLFQQKIIPTQLTIRGMNLHITRTVEGKLKIKGVDLEGLTTSVAGDKKSNSAFERWLLQRSEIGVEDSTFAWKDEQNAGLTWFFDDVNFLLKNNDDHHQLSLSSKLPNALGDRIKIEFDFEGNIAHPSLWVAKLFVESKKINLKPLHKYIKNKSFNLNDGSIDLKLWADWKNEGVKQLSGNVKLYDVLYKLNEKKPVSLNFVSAIFDSRQEENNIWNVSVDKFNYKNNKRVWPESKFSLVFDHTDNKIENFYIKADYLKLGALTQIINDNNLVGKKNKKLLNNLNLHGDIRDFHIAWKKNKLHKFKAKFDKFGINAWDDFPKVKDLSGDVEYEHENGSLSLLSENTVVGFPGLFRHDFKLKNITADIKFADTQEGMVFDIKHLKAENTEVNTISTATLWLPKNNSSPYLDFQTHVTKGDASKVSNYLPVGIMDEALVNWLDQGFLGGEVNKSTIVFNGKLNDFPFDNKEGVFIVDIDISDIFVNYLKNWPKIENAKATCRITGQGLKVHLLKGNMEKNIIYNSYAEINSFSEPELKLNIAAVGSSHNAMQYLVNSSILPEAKNTVDSMRLIGEVTTDIEVNIPLDEKVRIKNPLSYSGSAELRDVSLFMVEDKLDVTEGSGQVFFTEKKLSSKNLIANIFGEKAKLSATSLAKNRGIKIAAKGKINPGELLNRFDIPGAKKISGLTSYQANIIFPTGKGKNNHPTLRMNSNLFGVKSVLPEILYKRKSTKKKLKFKTIFKGNNKTQFELDFGKKGSAVLELRTSKGKTYLNKGAVSISNKKAILPRKNILYVDGTINKFTPYKWNKALGLDQAKKGQTFFIHPIVLNLDELKIFTDPKTGEVKKSAITKPKNIPMLEGIIKKLYFDKTFLGRLDFKVSQKKRGLHLDELILSSKNMKLVGHGDWHYIRGNHRTEMDITLSSENFGGMLTDLGFAAIIDNGTAKTVGKLNWKGAPVQFSLDRLNGNIQLNIENGNIIEVDASAGRLLGLFSLSALPRKLFGDFKDTFKSGFSFDSAYGEIKIENGDAYTDGFELSSAVAEISVSGRTGLTDRDYENVVEVVPDVGGGIAGVTALLVNLPAGIGLWLLDKITGEQFNEASTRIYEITGSWDEPVIELLEDE